MSNAPEEPIYPEDERLRRLQEEPDRRMTRDEWEREESHARQAAHDRHAHEQKPADHRSKQEKAEQEKAEQEKDGESKKKSEQKPDRKKIVMWIVIGLVVLAIVFIIGFIPRHIEQDKAKRAAKQRETEAPEVEVVQVKRSHTPGELTVPGTTAPLTEAYIYARANGYLKKRYADIGDHVKKGQLLGLIDAPDLDQQVDQGRQQLNQAIAQVEQQQAQLALNKVTWERWRTLVAKGVFSRQDGDQREANYLAQAAGVASAQRNVESYRANLARLIALQSYERVTAPFDGVITERNVDVGALVGASGGGSMPPMENSQASTGGSSSVGSANTSGSSGNASQSASPSTGGAQGGALFGIAQIDVLRILVSVPEGYATSIHRGMAAKVFTQERVGKPAMGLVTRTANSIDQNSRTMLVEVDLDNKSGGLYPGMYSIVSFVQVRGEAPLTIPGDAVVVRKDRTSVALVRDNKVQLVPVDLGRDYGPSVEILSGLSEGDWVAATVTDSVQAGITVRTHESKDSAQESSAQTNDVPDSGPSQYGDQSIVNSKSESTNQKGKAGKGGSDQKGGQKSGGQDSQKQGGPEKGSDKESKQ